MCVMSLSFWAVKCLPDSNRSLIAWVERKNLSWTDKETGKDLTVAEIAYLIRGRSSGKALPLVMCLLQSS